MDYNQQQLFKDQAEEKVSEFLRCKNSFIYFCSNYIYIEKPGGDALLKPYEPQKKLIDLIDIHKFVIVLKSRQIGISTVVQAYCTWLEIFFDNVVIGIISKDGAEATDFARKIRGMLEKLPSWMSPGFSKQTEQSFILKNGSKVYVSPVNPNAPEKTLRGKAITFLVIDEAAFIKFLDAAWTSMVPALATNQMQAKQAGVPHGTIILSTPNKTVGVGQWFFDKYTRAVNGDDIFKDYVIHWKDIQELAGDPNWYEQQCKLFDNDKRKIEQELELKFLATSGSFFEEYTIQVLQDSYIEPIQKLKLYNGEAWVFQKPIPGRYYLIGVDTAPEHGDDKSAITVWDYMTLEQVWEYQGKLAVTNFIKIVEVAIQQYPGLLIIESNSYGNQVVEHFDRSQYSTLLYKEKRGINVLQPGISTNTKTRPLMIDALYTYITQHPECIKSHRLVLELIGLIEKKSGRVEADSGCKDDIAMTAAMCYYVHKWDPPLMIEAESNRGITNDIASILGMNDDLHQDIPSNNTEVIKRAKEQLDEDPDANFIDVLSFYRS